MKRKSATIAPLIFFVAVGWMADALAALEFQMLWQF